MRLIFKEKFHYAQNGTKMSFWDSKLRFFNIFDYIFPKLYLMTAIKKLVKVTLLHLEGKFILSEKGKWVEN